MRFSVVTVSYNHAEFIRDTIESVLAQRHPDFEHIVVDGGSTDGTVEILREYPHLKWTSEPDRGQSHALNKGFAQATGDVICWLNSDDWYAQNAFAEVEKCLGASSVLIGACQLATRDGTPYEARPNVPRSWFDILKYWVYHSSPDQPSIFFRRSLLENFRLPNGDFIDENLHFAMDFDWWLRIGRKHPLTTYTPSTLSFIRTHDTAKTGAHMASVYREMSRVFRRHENALCFAEQYLSVVIPFEGPLSFVKNLLDKINASSLPRIEVILADHSPDRAVARQNQKEAFLLEKKFSRLILRHLRSQQEPESRWNAVDYGIRCSHSPIVVVVDSTASFGENTALELARIFEHDNVGAVVSTSVASENSGGQLMTAPQSLKIPSASSGFAVRRAAYLEAFEQRGVDFGQLQLRAFIARLIHRAWLVQVSDVIPGRSVESRTLLRDQSFGVFTNSALLDEFYHDTHSNLFAALRAKNGFALQVPEDLWQLARQHLQQAPQEWTSVNERWNESALRDFIRVQPTFVPARLLLVELLEKSGSHELAHRERQEAERLSHSDRTSPLYS